MLEAFKSIFEILWAIVKWPLAVCGVLFIVFFVLITVNIFILRAKGMRAKSIGAHYKVKKPNIFMRLFILFPHRYAKDILERDPEFFKYQGCIVYTGHQGSGKTSALVHDTMQIQQEYPKARTLSNLGYKYADDELTDWTQLIDYQNPAGKDRGVMVQIDEMQNWFSSKQSKDFPPEMLQIITQNRKNRRVIFGTAQNFYMLAKDIRSQCTEIRKCFTAFGCLTFIRRYEPEIDESGECKKLKYRGCYFFVHSDALRNAYDTYHVINSLRKSGFYERNNNGTNLNVVVTTPEKHGLFHKKK